MPISSGAGKWTRPARINKTNLKRSSDWPDVAQSSSSLASSKPNAEGRMKGATTKKTIRGGSSTTAFALNEKQNSSHGKQLTTSNTGSKLVHSLSADQKQKQISIEKRIELTIQSHKETSPPAANRFRKIMNSLGGQRVITGNSAAAIDKTSSPNTMGGEQLGAKQQMDLTSTLVLGGGGTRVDTNPTASDDYKKPRGLAGGADAGKTYSLSGHKSALNFHLASQHKQQQLQVPGKGSLQGSQASLLNNPSMSFQTNAASSAATSAASSLTNLHNQHAHSSRGAPLNISKRVNLKYVKSLVVLLMSLDLLITVFVYHFSSQDELPVAFTSHKLRFSLLNLILSSVWFIVLTSAIIFDIYPILLIGCLVDFASFLLLLVCSFIHFTHRIDYNTVNLTSLLLLLFSIIVLHVYLLVIAALTTYLMLAVRRRRKIHS